MHLKVRPPTDDSEIAESILTTARELFLRHGSNFTSLDLAREVGISPPALYKHFSSRDTLLLAVLHELVEQTVASMREDARGALAPADRLEIYARALLAHVPSSGATRATSYIASESWRLQHAHPAEAADAFRPLYALFLEECSRAHKLGLASGCPSTTALCILHLLTAQFHASTGLGSVPSSAQARAIAQFIVSATIHDGTSR